MADPDLQIRHLGLTDYQWTWDAMRTFTDGRSESTSDELWITEHPPVFTQGLNGKPEHLLEVLTEGKADAALVASMVHYGDYTVSGLKAWLQERGVKVRMRY